MKRNSSHEEVSFFYLLMIISEHHSKMEVNDKWTHLLPHRAVSPHKVICTAAVQIFGLLFAVFLTVFFVNTLDRSEGERLQHIMKF